MILEHIEIILELHRNDQRFFQRKDGSLDLIIEIKTTLAQMRRVGELKSIFGFCIYLHVNSKNNTPI